MNVESEYRPDAAEAQDRAETEPRVEGEPTGVETQLEPEDALARFSREVSGRFGAPVAESGTEEAEEGSTELRSQLDIAAERAGEATPEEIAGREARTREQEQARDERVGELAQELLDQRMAGTISYAAVDKFLSEQGVEPWTKESAQIMEAWDRVQADKVYQQTVAQFERGISSAQEQIEALGKQVKETNYKGKIAKLEGAIMAHEVRSKELREKKDVFAFPKPEASAVVAPEPEPVVAEAPQAEAEPEVVAEPAEEAPAPSAQEAEPQSVGAAAARDFEQGVLSEGEGNEDFSFEAGQELWYRAEDGTVRHAWVQQEAGTEGNNLVLEERADDGHVTASYSYDPERLGGQLLSESEVGARTRQLEAESEEEVDTAQGETNEKRKFEAEQVIELSEGKRVRIIKKRFARDTYQVADITDQGLITPRKSWYNMAGSELRKGSLVEEESGDDSGEAPEEETRAAA